MIDTSNLTKLYYSIGEVAEMLNVNASLIRFWEKEFTQLNPKKNKKGNRKFTPDDIKTLSLIYQLVKTEGRTIEGAKKAIKNKRNADELSLRQGEVETLINRLQSVREKLLKLKKTNES